MERYTPYQVAVALALYEHNATAIMAVDAAYRFGREDIAEALHPNYVREKAEAFVDASGHIRLSSIMGQLDTFNQRRFVDAALARYGEEARRMQK